MTSTRTAGVAYPRGFDVLGRGLLMIGILSLLYCPVFGTIDFGQTTIDVANVLEKFGSIYSAVNECEFTCPDGYKRIRIAGHVVSHNGCGSYGVQISLDQFPEITKCCNKHDTCYDTCGSDKTTCDHKLKSCVKNICDNLKDTSLEQSCKSVVKVIYGSVAVLGCPAFLEAQKKACYCQPVKRKQSTHKEL